MQQPKEPETPEQRYHVFKYCVSWICTNWNIAEALLNERDTGFKGDPYAMLQHRGRL